MPYITFYRHIRGETRQEKIHIDSNLATSSFKERTNLIGTSFCDIISLSCTQIDEITKNFYCPSRRLNEDNNPFFRTFEHTAVFKSRPKESNRLKLDILADSRHEKELLYKKLLEYNNLFEIYANSIDRIYDVIDEVKYTINFFLNYVDLCSQDPFYADPNFIGFMRDIKKIDVFKLADQPLDCVDDLENQDLKSLKKIYNTSLKTGAYFTKFSADSFFELCSASLYTLCVYELKIKKCENCGKFFIPYNRSDTIYCDRISPQDNSRTCKEYGSQKLWYDKLKDNETLKLYRNIYQSKQMLAKRNPDIIDYSDSFEKFKVQSKQWKADLKANIKTEEEYLQWLKTVKEKKVL